MPKLLFYIGQIVICIDDDFSWARKTFPLSSIRYPTFGSRYVVRGYVCRGKCPAIVLREFSNPDVVYMDGKIREAGFWQDRFVGAPPPIEETTKKEVEEVA